MSSAVNHGLSVFGTEPYPLQPLHHLDALWIQVAGTLCNLACTHCFVSSGPGNDRHAMLSRETVRERVAEAVLLGVKEFYFTGGEPFLHPDLNRILADTLTHGPCTVLTNGTLITTRVLDDLVELDASTRYSLEIRVSLDGPSADTHDRIRGEGSFARTLDALKRLERCGLLPIVTVTRFHDEDELAFRARYADMLRGAGLRHPRLKILPLFLIGRESTRRRGYAEDESLRDLDLGAFDPQRLQCGGSRAVSSRGVFVCPLLVDEPGGRIGERLDQALEPHALRHGACFTCYVTGMTCGNG